MTTQRLSFVTDRQRPALALHLLSGKVIACKWLTPLARRSLRVCLLIIALALMVVSARWPHYSSQPVAAASAPAATIVVNSTADAELSEIQLVTVTGSGTFTLTFNGQTTGAIMPSIIAQAENSLTALPSIGGVGGRVYVSKSGDVFRIIFSGTLGATNLPQITATGMGGATTSVSTEQDGTVVCPGANCTLRGAIAAASPGDTIQFSSLFNTPQTITLTAGELPLDKDLTIEGPGANLLTVNGNNASRVFYLSEPSLGAPQVLRTVTLSGMTIANGNGVGRSVINGGVGGGIYNGGHLTLLNIAVIGSSTIQGGGILLAFSETTLDIIGSTLSGNTASDRGGAIAFRCAPCMLNLTNSTIAGNSTSNSGGALAIPINGPFIGVNIRNSTITGNSSPNGSGGLEIGVPGARLNVKNSLLALNTGPDVRMVNGVFTSQGDNLIGNLTTTGGVTTTQASDQLGADPLLELDGMSKPLLAFNNGPTQTVRLLSGSPALDKGASSIFDEAQTVVVTGSAGTFTLTFNGQTTSALAFNAVATDVQTALNALSSIGGAGGNVTVSKSGTRYIFLFGGALAATNLPLMTAAGTGGATATVGALVDGGNAPLTTDQRGQTRPVNLPGIPDADGGNGSDIGAYEAQCATTEPTITPSSLPSAVSGTPYTQTLAAAGGTPPFIFTVSSGSLPPGLTLAQDGTLSGTPTTPGTFNFTVMLQDGSSCGSSRNYSLDVACTSASLTPATLPNAAINVAYSQTITALPAGGGFTFALTSGALPAGLSLASDGTLSGTPTENGVFSFRVTATSGACSGFRDYTLAISCLTISPASLPNGTVSAAYSQTISALPSASYSFTVSSGVLPNGLSLNATTGALTGTPTTAGTFNFTVTASSGCTGAQSYSVTIGCPAITLAALSSATAGSSYAGSVAASPAGTYTYSVLSGSLPAGLSLNASTGVIAGTPTAPGTFNFSIQALAASGCSGTQSYSLAVNCPTITLSALPTPSLNSSYNQTVTASPSGSYSFAVTAGALPNGLSLNSATGVVSGTPVAAGAYSFMLTATSSGGCTGSNTYSGTIGGGSCQADITLAALPSGNVGQSYVNYATALPVASYTYGVTAGSLPPGLTLYAAIGLVIGYPTAAGSYSFTITATDSNGCVGTRSYTVGIN